MPIFSETLYVLNNFPFLIHGVLVMFMAAGFAMLEAYPEFGMGSQKI